MFLKITFLFFIFWGAFMNQAQGSVAAALDAFFDRPSVESLYERAQKLLAESHKELEAGRLPNAYFEFKIFQRTGQLLYPKHVARLQRELAAALYEESQKSLQKGLLLESDILLGWAYNVGYIPEAKLVERSSSYMQAQELLEESQSELNSKRLILSYDKFMRAKELGFGLRFADRAAAFQQKLAEVLYKVSQIDLISIDSRDLYFNLARNLDNIEDIKPPKLRQFKRPFIVRLKRACMGIFGK